MSIGVRAERFEKWIAVEWFARWVAERMMANSQRERRPSIDGTVTPESLNFIMQSKALEWRG